MSNGWRSPMPLIWRALDLCRVGDGMESAHAAHVERAPRKGLREGISSTGMGEATKLCNTTILLIQPWTSNEHIE